MDHKLGVVFPQNEIGNDPGAIKHYAQTAENLGYDYILAYDHVLGANPDRPGGWEGRPYDFNSPFHEVFVLFSYLAGVTERIEFATGVLILPQRQTALVAKQAAQLDLLSGGRLRLGVGIGWNDVEYEALGEDFSMRGKRSTEQVQLLKALWTQELVKFEGDFDRIPDAGINPLPVQRPIPIWFGGSAEPVLKRMAQYGDGWMPNTNQDEKFLPLWERLQGYLQENGRDPANFGIEMRISMRQSPFREWGSEVERLRKLGATHISLNTMGVQLTSPDEHIQAIWRFKEMV